MMRILSTALVALCQWHCLLEYMRSTATAQQINSDKENSNTADKSLEFVNIIRDDLRRNNDDYELLEGENQLADASSLAHHVKSSHPAHVQPVHPAYPVLPGRPTPEQPNRNIISPPVPRLQPAHPAPARSARPAHARPTHSPARVGPLRRFDTRQGEADLNQPAAINTNQFRSYTRSKHYKNLRLNKLKQLLNKDKINMRQEDLVKDEPQAEGQPKAEDTTTALPPATELTTQSSPLPTTPEYLPSPSPLTHAPTMQRQPFQPHQVRREPGLMVRNVARTMHSPSFQPNQVRRESSPMMRSRKESSPSPEQLDMAPAINPQLIGIRIKGRLCQRSLMNAEGPTYDKQGNVLEPAFQPRSVRGRKFHQTRAPSLVLPRCCNCCKKSVLGCQ